MAIHTGVNRITLDRLQRQEDMAGSVPWRCLLTAWMLHMTRENPLYAEFDYLCEILKNMK